MRKIAHQQNRIGCSRRRHFLHHLLIPCTRAAATDLVARLANHARTCGAQLRGIAQKEQLVAQSLFPVRRSVSVEVRRQRP
jgi:hypothetical protein